MSKERYRIQAAHIRSGTGGGMGLKPCDSWVVPLSVEAHALQHRHGEITFWGDKLDAAKSLARFLWKHTGKRDMCLAAIKAFREI